MSVPATSATTLGQQHQQAFELLLDFDARAQTTANGQHNRDLQATWFGLQVTVGKSKLLLPQQQLAEVLSPPALTPIPGTPAWVLGLANHYGQLLPVVDLYGFIHGRSWPDAVTSRVIVTDTEPTLGLVVTELGHSVRTTPPVARNEALEVDKSVSRWVAGQTNVLGNALPVLELAPLIEAATHWKRN